MFTKTDFQTQIQCNPPEGQQPAGGFVRELPDIPVLPKTLLLLDLVMQERAVDLRELAQIVLADLGATLQILRLAGRECGCDEAPMNRIEDCISGLGLNACMNAVSAKVVPTDGRRNAIAALWDHSQEIGLRAKLLAEERPGVRPEDAYLAGLLHDIGSLPDTLGWTWRRSSADPVSVPRNMATRWSLPECVLELFSPTPEDAAPSGMAEIVRMAHLRSEASYTIGHGAISQTYGIQ